MYKKILAAVNEHLNSAITARYAINLARACGAKLFLCFVAEKGMSEADIEKADDAVNALLRGGTWTCRWKHINSSWP
jgi:hypothetical protein